MCSHIRIKLLLIPGAVAWVELGETLVGALLLAALLFLLVAH